MATPQNCRTPRGIIRKDVEDFLFIGEEPKSNACHIFDFNEEDSPKKPLIPTHKYIIAETPEDEKVEKEDRGFLSPSDIFIECISNRDSETRFLEIPPSPIPSQSRTHRDCLCPQVLVVDDNIFNLRVTESLIKNRFELSTEKALNGKVAIDKLLNTNTDCTCGGYRLILMDCNMPVMDGYEATMRLRELMKEGKICPVPIIALTAFSTQNDKLRCIKSGMCDFLKKPVLSEELEQIFKKYKVL